MSTTENKQTDEKVAQVKDVLRSYLEKHPDAQIEVQRQNKVSIRIRIIDPDFAGVDRMDREPAIWKLLDALPEDTYADLTMLLLLTPEESESSFANMEFNNPIPSRL